jgi:predicted nucleotide-binding protein (sugar kinase/HSP70/actin superfamily)
MQKRVGIPRALLFYKFGELWQTFFSELGAKVIISPKTSKSIKDAGVSNATDEDCYSTKLYHGHALWFKDKVDYLFIPRFGSAHKKHVGCPKFQGLADVLRFMYPDLPEIIRPYYSEAKAGHGKLTFLYYTFQIGFRFTRNPFRILRALRKALEAHREHKRKLIISESQLTQWEQSQILVNPPAINRENETPLKVALAAHVYVLNDVYSSIEIRQKLREYGVNIITSEQMPRAIVEQQMDILKRDYYNMYFEYEREILGTILYFIKQKTVDGIIHIQIFPCGPDSIVGELASRFSTRDPEIPLLQLTFDELTGDVGLNTRLEAFVDLIRRKRNKQQQLTETETPLRRPPPSHLPSPTLDH